MSVSAVYRNFNALLREHIAPASSLVSALAALCVGVIAIYTNLHSLRMMSVQLEQYEAGQYQQFQGSVALAWRTLGEANAKRFEVGQSTSLYYLAVNHQLYGNVTLNSSTLNMTDPSPTKAGTVSQSYVQFDLTKSSFCGTEITTYVREWTAKVRATFAFALMRSASLVGDYDNADFLAADMQAIHLTSIKGRNARFAATDLRRAVFSGGVFSDADFQGADLREARSERGLIGAGYQFGSELNTFEFYPDYSEPAVWPPLFDPKNGINDVLSLAGLKSSRDGASYAVDFSKANFAGADLRGAQLQETNISQAQINTACADDTTRLPEGRKVVEGCVRPALYREKIGALRAPMQHHPLENACAMALQDQ